MQSPIVDRFECLSIGLSASLLRTVMETDLITCAQVSGDDNPIHMSEVYAVSKGFPGRVAHGFFTASMVSALIGTHMPGPGTICLRQNLNYLGPVQIGDVVFARVEIAELIRDRRRVRLLYDCWVDTKRVLDGEALVKVPE